MTAIADASGAAAQPAPARVHLDQPLDMRAVIIFLAVIAGGLFFMAYSIYADIAATKAPAPTTILPYLLLGVAMVIALGFEFVNGFHDTANAVATVIYTHSLQAAGRRGVVGLLEPRSACSGRPARSPSASSRCCRSNSSCRSAPSAGFAMVFALLIAAIIWNLGTWSLGLPASSSHTLIGSIVGVGVANALMRGQDGTSGVDWDQVYKIGQALLLSPLFGFILSAALLLVMKALIRKPELYTAPTTRLPAAAVDPRPADPDLHAGVVLPRLQRRAEGHGPDHADPHRRRADRLCAQPRACRSRIRRSSSPRRRRPPR